MWIVHLDGGEDLGFRTKEGMLSHFGAEDEMECLAKAAGYAGKEALLSAFPGGIEDEWQLEGLIEEVAE